MDNAISEGMQSLLLAAVLEHNPFVYHVVDEHVCFTIYILSLSCTCQCGRWRAPALYIYSQ